MKFILSITNFRKFSSRSAFDQLTRNLLFCHQQKPPGSKLIRISSRHIFILKQKQEKLKNKHTRIIKNKKKIIFG